MPRKPKASMEALSDAVAEFAAPVSKKRALPKSTTTSTRTPNTSKPAKPTAAKSKKTAPARAAADAAPKRAARTKSPKTAATAAKLNGNVGGPRAAKTAALDANSYHEDIARLAYYFWEQRGRVDGSPEEDWLRAEQEWRRTILTESA